MAKNLMEHHSVDSLRHLMGWHVVPQATVMIGLDMGQLLKFVGGKLDLDDERIQVIAHYLVSVTGMTITQQLAKREADGLPSPSQQTTKNVPANAGKGRSKGTQNLMTREMKDLVFEAGERVGEDGKGTNGMLGYLMTLAKTYPTIYSSLLLRLMPPAVAVVPVVPQGELTINITPIKAGTYFAPEEVAEMLGGGAGRRGPKIIEGTVVK